MLLPYIIMLNIRCVYKLFCLANTCFLIIVVNIDATAITKKNEMTPVNCRGKFDFDDLWDPVP